MELFPEALNHFTKDLISQTILFQKAKGPTRNFETLDNKEE